MLRLGIVAAAALLAACSTAAETVYEARLLDSTDGVMRDMVRNYVRDVVGPDYIVDIGELGRTSQLTARDRGRQVPGGQRIPVPDVLFRLEMVSGQCQLAPPPDMRNAPVLVLPQNVRCEPIPRVI